MTSPITPTQRAELKELLLSRRRELQAQMSQNLQNLAPAENTAGNGAEIGRASCRERV